MNDSDTIFSDDSDDEIFTEEFLNNIPEDSDDEYLSEENFSVEDSNASTLTLEVGLTFLTWKSALIILSNGLINKRFYFQNSILTPIDSMDDNSISSANTLYVSINKQRLYYVNIQGLTKLLANPVMSQFIDLLENYTDKNQEAFELEKSQKQPI
ncbi:hypothetical protein C1645_833048 [Glomus cerebriforme]|uniref:Uncharacterized protein n=1 Tax=Glomus cerebriforme TaxID=658196 RepID=A0A397SIB2_9GLOM|nr:hypothetical protein C1645_833048 [Glomus cerebriforme]